MVYPIQSKAGFLQKFIKTSHLISMLKPARNIIKGVIP